MFGSFNMTNNANTKNYEFIYISHREDIAQRFMNQFMLDWENISNENEHIINKKVFSPKKRDIKNAWKSFN